MENVHESVATEKKGCEFAWRLSESHFDRKVRVLKLESARLAPVLCCDFFPTSSSLTLDMGEKGAAATERTTSSQT